LTKRARKAELRRKQEARKLAQERAASTRKRNAQLRKVQARKRSEAAKRGAETRKRNAAQKVTKRSKRKPTLAERMAIAGGSLRAHQIAHKEELAEGKRVARERGLEWVKQDGTVGTMPSIVRHAPDANALLRDLEDAAGITGEDFWRILRNVARQNGISLKEAYALLRDSEESVFSPAFRRRARILAKTEGVSLREVYTLWFSP
jgi:hypothetical protein